MSKRKFIAILFTIIMDIIIFCVRKVELDIIIV